MPISPQAEKISTLNYSPFNVLQAEGGGQQGGICGCGKGETGSKTDSLARELAEIIKSARLSAGGPNAVGHVGENPVSNEMPDATYHIDGSSPLLMCEELSHQFIDGRHLWIGVREGTTIVLSDLEHEAFKQMSQGTVPAAVAGLFSVQAGGDNAAWRVTSDLIGRLATAGFLKNIVGYHDAKIPQPERFARFHLTKACQLECIHCYADSSPYVDRTGELSTERWIRLLEDFSANGGERILFTGGEALLHKGCIPLMKRSHELGVEVTLFTNGMQIPKYAQQIQDCVDIVQVSLDGPDEKSNDLVRGQGTFRRILRAIDLLVDQGTRVRIGMSVMEQNWDAWKAGFTEISRRYGSKVDYRLGLGVTHYGRASDFPEELNIEEVQPKVDAMLDSVSRGTPLPRITRRTTGCGYCEQFVVGPRGHVYPCHLLDHEIGHIDDLSVSEYTRLLREIAGYLDVDHTEGCSTCDIRYLCGGSCRVMNGKYSGSRLITTCTPEERHRKYRNLVTMYKES